MGDRFLSSAGTLGAKKHIEKKTRKQNFHRIVPGFGVGFCLWVLFSTITNDPKKHINNFFTPTQSQDNPANLFMFVCPFPQSTGKKYLYEGPNSSPVLDKNHAHMGPEILSTTQAGVWRKAPKQFPDPISVLDTSTACDITSSICRQLRKVISVKLLNISSPLTFFCVHRKHI